MGDGLVISLGVRCYISELVQFLKATSPEAEAWQKMLCKQRHHDM